MKIQNLIWRNKKKYIIQFETKLNIKSNHLTKQKIIFQSSDRLGWLCFSKQTNFYLNYFDKNVLKYISKSILDGGHSKFFQNDLFFKLNTWKCIPNTHFIPLLDFLQKDYRLLKKKNCVL